ncbi:MAG: diadenylate cyclase CdaA [Vicinamibacteraceae bacterium]|nr:diadenylate cyclase CdaA [Vicinamibacteraceae bacterium]
MTVFTEWLRSTPVTWWDVLDILIVAILFYEFLKLIRGTRAVQMAFGTLLIAILFFASRLAPLQTVNWLIRNLVGYVVFAAIVIFQNDIRRALANLGRMRVFRYLSSRTDTGQDENIEEVLSAAFALSDRKLGAIIAFERDIGLRNYIESGIPLDSAITYDLLLSIFQKAAPLHDGATIIQEGRIAAAACFLPLTVNPQLSRELGARHRAAIGLTEETDAAAIIVSEETGIVSLAVDGRVERSLTAEGLRRRLHDLLFIDMRPAAARARETSRDSREVT